MPVEEDGRLPRRAQPFAIHQRIAFAFDQLGGQPRGAQLVARELGGAADIGLVLGKRADAGNAQEGLQSLEKLGLVLLVIVHGCSNIISSIPPTILVPI